MVRLMTRSRISHPSRYLIGLVTFVYSVLLVMAAGCALAHADRSQSQQHHHGEQGSSTQNSLCAWACQATADTAVAIGSPSTVAELVVALSILVSDQPILSISSAMVHSRAPPSIPFFRLG